MSSRGYTNKDILTANGSVSLLTHNNSEHYHELTFTFSATPSAGTIQVEARPRMSQDFFPVPKGEALDVTVPLSLRFVGNVEEFRFTFAGVAGATTVTITDLASDDGDMGLWYGGYTANESVDEITKAGITIESSHAEIHAGEAFRVGTIETSDLIEYLLTVGSVKQLHIISIASAEDTAILTVFEGPTAIAGGTTPTPINRNRSSSEVSTASVVLNPTSIGADGTLLEGVLLPGAGLGANRTGSESGTRLEWVLATDTVYLFRLSINSVTESLLALEWYEEPA